PLSTRKERPMHQHYHHTSFSQRRERLINLRDLQTRFSARRERIQHLHSLDSGCDFWNGHNCCLTKLLFVIFNSLKQTHSISYFFTPSKREHVVKKTKSL